MVVSGCGKGGPTVPANGGAAGSAGQTFDVLVFRPTDGVVTSGDNTINCGSAADQTKCAATYAWGAVVTLTATPNAGKMFSTWAGDCWTAGPCILNTASSGADKYVVAVFGPMGLTQHPNWTPPPPPPGGYASDFTTVHGQEFLKWIDLKRVTSDNTADQLALGYFDCAACHGGSFDGMGTAPSCNACHAANGHANWKNECNFCHGLPPPPTARPLSPSANHPPVGGGAPACAACHSDTVNADGTTNNWTTGTQTNTHMNGKVDGGGHAPGFNDPATHSAAFFATIKANGSAAGCTQCHGADYGTIVPTLSAGNQSCNTCHANAPTPHPDWLNECDFCHGAPPPPQVNDLTATHPTTTAPCYGCHSDTVTSGGALIPSGPHMNGVVDLTSPHTANFATPSVHGPQFFTTVAAEGTSNECKTCHGADYSANMGGGKSCDSCHATAIASWPVSDNGAGSASSNTAWQSNCTFCHGLKMSKYASAELPFSAPPDDIAQRLAGGGAANEVLSRTGQHSIHMFDGGIIPINGGALECSTCHIVPSTIEASGHITSNLIAPVSITPAGAFPHLAAADLAKLPSPLVTWDATARTCTGYCHGSSTWGGNNTTMIWTDDYSTPVLGCNDCHGQPPPTGRTVQTALTTGCTAANGFPNGCANHIYHSRVMSRPAYGYDSCANCHYGSANGPYFGLHVNGKTDMVWTPAGAINPITQQPYKAFTATWDPVAKTCTASCHITSGTSTVQSW